MSILQQDFIQSSLPRKRRKRGFEIWPGTRSGMLTVINECLYPVVTPKGQKIAVYFCQCECGNATIVHKAHLVSGHTQSCGCLHLTAITKHGKCRSRSYIAWQHMIDRCKNPKAKDYSGYGRRGITVCQRWESYENFLADMGEPPNGLSLERVNNNQGYFPENCRWATRKEQQSNRRVSVLIEYDGLTLTLSEWARRANLSRSSIKRRLEKGWTIEDALLTPPANVWAKKGNV